MRTGLTTLERLAESIHDGRPVDWQRETTDRPDLAESIEGLRRVESLLRAFRDIGPTEAAVALDEPPASAGPAAPEVAIDSPLRWGALEIRARIGGGAFGDVYRAYDPTLDREVALKLWKTDAVAPPDLDVLLAEARRLAHVRHPNVLVVHGAGHHDGRAGMWTELLRGPSLFDIVRERGPMSPAEAAAVGAELCGALAAVHAQGLVHRDVKAANVVRDHGGAIVLTDFGSVGVLREDMATGVTIALRGTPIAMPPEQLAGARVDPTADLYALGVLLYWLVSRRYPVEAESLEDLERRHRTGDSIPLRDRRPDLPEPFVDLVERALDPSPTRRFASAGEMERALRGYLGLVSPEPESRPVPRPLAPMAAWWRSHRVRLAMGLAAALVVVMLVPRGDAPDPPREIAPHGPPHPAAPPTESAAHTKPAPGAAAASVRAPLFRVAPGAPEALGSGARVAPGDQLFLLVTCAVPTYVYVVHEDAFGEFNVLHPSAPGAPPLTPGPDHVLPEPVDGVPRRWQVTTAAGREWLFVVASPSERPELPDAVRAMKSRSLRGLQTVRARSLIAELLEDLYPDAAAANDPVIVTYQLENPGG